MKKRLLFLLVLIPVFTFGGVFEINTQGLKATGMAGAFSGIANDASALYFNPGAISFQEKPMLNAGFNMMMFRASFLSPSDGNIDTKTTLMVPFHLYITHHFANRKLSGGIGIYAPFGTSIKWNDAWPGRYLTQQTKLSTIFLQPTISYRFDDHYSAGIGLVGAAGFIKMKKAIEVNDDIELKLKGKGFGYGFNIGGFAHFDQLNFSMNYRSSVKLNINKGDAKFSDVPPSFIEQQTLPETAKFSSSFKLPSTVTIGVGYFPTERIIVGIEMSFTTWKDFKDWNININDFPQLNDTLNRNFVNTFTFRIGGQYHWSDKMDYRIGASYAGTPSSEGNLYPDLPDALKFVVAGGATRHISDKLSFDAAISIEDYAQRKESNNKNTFNGSYQKKIYSFGLGVHYEF